MKKDFLLEARPGLAFKAGVPLAIKNAQESRGLVLIDLSHTNKY
jgi:hypothetical protein